jgi:hypothetical protein
MKKRTRRSPLAPRPQPQSSIPMPVQTRKNRVERKYLWNAIRSLRACKFKVYRRGSDHSVDGRQLSNRELLKLSRTIKRQA